MTEAEIKECKQKKHVVVETKFISLRLRKARENDLKAANLRCKYLSFS
jgi:hypothetical protein